MAAAKTGALYKDLPVGNYSVGFQILSINDLKSKNNEHNFL